MATRPLGGMKNKEILTPLGSEGRVPCRWQDDLMKPVREGLGEEGPDGDWVWLREAPPKLRS